MIDLQTLLSSVAASGLLTAALIFFSKTWISERIKGAIKHEYDQKLETYKAEVKAENDISLEKFKAQLQLEASQRKIRLSGAFERTINVCSEIFQRLHKLKRCVIRYSSAVMMQSEHIAKNEETEFLRILCELTDYFDSNRPFLTKKGEAMIDDLIVKINNAGVALLYSESSTPRDREKSLGAFYDATEIVNNQVPPLLKNLTDELRQILGVYEASSKL